MQPALHQHARAAQFDRLANLLVDRVEVENVAFLRRRPLQRPVKRAEGAVLGAEVGVVDVAVDDVGDHAFGMQLAAHRVRFHPDADQVIGLKHLQRLLFGQGHRDPQNVLILAGTAPILQLRDDRVMVQFGKICIRASLQRCRNIGRYERL